MGSLVQIDPKSQVMVHPPGINRLPGMASDVRTLDKLFNGNNHTYDDLNMWLAPFKFTRSAAAANSQSQTSDKREPNFISIMFDQPTCISAVRLWNYSKTASRGVHEFELVVDDKPIYRGFANQAPETKGHPDTLSTSVVFSSEPRLVDRFKKQIKYDDSKEQEVLLFNERRQVNQVTRPNEKFVFNE